MHPRTVWISTFNPEIPDRALLLHKKFRGKKSFNDE